MTTYFRIHDTEDCAAEDLLRAEHQVSRVWDGYIAVACEVCCGDGEDLDAEPGTACRACRGRGEHQVDQQTGVSVCRSLEALRRYLDGRSPYRHDGVVLVELEGEEMDEDDVDHADGAVLVRPTRIVSVSSVDALDVEWSEC